MLLMLHARLWFEELTGIWDVCDINPGWEAVIIITQMMHEI